MPAGDRQRTWFPEMVEVLRAEWCAEMSWDAGSVIGCGNMQELHTSNADKVGTQATVLARALCTLVA
ncbi:MAG: hypothetical protein ACHQ9S_14910 [Candidatus Binatia bacterium]